MNFVIRKATKYNNMEVKKCKIILSLIFDIISYLCSLNNKNDENRPADCRKFSLKFRRINLPLSTWKQKISVTSLAKKTCYT